MVSPSSSSPSAAPRWPWWLLSVLTLAGLAAWLLWPAQPLPVRASASEPPPATAELVQRGRYIATLGNCQGCHSQPGQPPYAGGAPVHTPFGTVYGPNLTPSEQGLGGWSARDFWRALHHGQAPDGRWLNPAFPYTSTTHISRDDSDALFAFLQSLPPDPSPSRPHELIWPYNTQVALTVWRALYFSAAPELARAPTDGIERGRYLAQGLGHCAACHSPRDRWGGLGAASALSGGLMPSGWYAPSLLDPKEAGVQGQPVADTVALLGQGRNAEHRVSGPMADVVAQSLRHWREDDLRALARHLADLPTRQAPRRAPAATTGRAGELGARVYEQQCASCHGKQGEGARLASGELAYPALAGNRAVTLDSPANLIRMVQEGGFGLPSAREPRPWGMPPFQLALDDAALAAVLGHIRQSWGNQASAVDLLEVHRARNLSP